MVLKICPDIGSKLCSILQVGEERLLKITADVPRRTTVHWSSNSFRAQATWDGTHAKLIAKAVSDHEGDVVISLTIGETTVDRLKLTIVHSTITVPLTATPSLRPNNAQLLAKYAHGADIRTMSPFVSKVPVTTPPDFSEDSKDPPLFLLRAEMKQDFRADILPKAAERYLRWDVERNPHDAPSIQTPKVPQHKIKMGPILELEQNATGSFRMQAWLHCPCEKIHAGCALKLVLLQVKLIEDNSKASQDYFNMDAVPPQTDGTTEKRSASGPGPSTGFRRPRPPPNRRPMVTGIKPIADATSRNRTGPPSAAFTSGANATEFVAKLQIRSGGPKADLFLRSTNPPPIQALWSNNDVSNSPDIIATYDERGTKTLSTMTMTEQLIPGRSDPRVFLKHPNTIPSPVLDTLDEVKDPKEVNLTSNGTMTIDKTYTGDGIQVTVKAEDAPNQDSPLFFPNPTNPHADSSEWTGDETYMIKKLEVNFHFRAAILVYTSSAKWQYGLVYKRDWSITGKWDLNGIIVEKKEDDESKADAGDDTEKKKMLKMQWIPDQARFPKVGLGPSESMPEIKDAKAAGFEVWPPGTVQHLGRVLKGF